MLGNFTEQGISKVKDSPKRAEAARASAKKYGVSVKEQYWTLGEFDIALIADAPDEASMTAFGLSLGALGNIRTQTLRAFGSEEIAAILGRVE
jgi:uncharacterized protein with GYD domain